LKIIDISLPLHPHMPVWPGDPAFQLERVQSIGEDSAANVSRMAGGVHIGTHVDAPLHFIEAGAAIDELDLSLFMGRAYVVEFGTQDHLDRKAFEEAKIPTGASRLLLKTSNSELWRRDDREFNESFLAVSADGADWLVETGIQLVGVDYLSVAPFQDSIPTHQKLLSAGIVVVEGLNLSVVEPGWYGFYCLPLKLVGSEGAPARAVLVQEA